MLGGFVVGERALRQIERAQVLTNIPNEIQIKYQCTFAMLHDRNLSGFVYQGFLPCAGFGQIPRLSSNPASHMEGPEMSYQT